MRRRHAMFIVGFVLIVINSFDMIVKIGYKPLDIINISQNSPPENFHVVPHRHDPSRQGLDIPAEAYVTDTELTFEKLAEMDISDQLRSIIEGLKPRPKTVQDLLKRMGQINEDFIIHTVELEAIMKPFGMQKAPQVPRTADHLVFMIMSGSVKIDRMVSKVETYGYGLKNFFAFSDAENTTLRMRTLPELAGKETYGGAQRRIPNGMRWLYHNESTRVAHHAEWFIIGDDDTWFNVPALGRFVSQFDPQLPLAFGYYWNNTFMKGAISSGGAGIVLSKKAFKQIGEHIMGEECPFKQLMGITINRCMEKMGVLKVQDARFHPSKVHNAFTRRNARGDVINQFTFHYENNVTFLSQITCYVADTFNRPELRAKNCTIDWRIA